jgi:uncharacterized protein (DUF305 family)
MVTGVPKMGIVGLVLLASVSACATNPRSQGPAPLSVEERAQVALADSLRSSYTDADIAFMSGMISHHAQALAMSDMAPTNEAGAEMLVLTARIINAQLDEIATMQRWLRERDLPVPDADPKGMKMEMNGESHMMMMPGMLSDEQMAKLKAARGIQFERLFLQYMIMHHQGAMTMVDKLFASFGAGQQDLIFKFASDVYADQSTEVARMQLMLIDRLGESVTN